MFYFTCNHLKNVFANVLQMFYFTCSYGLKLAQVEQVRRPERSQPSALCFAYPEKNCPSEFEETGPELRKSDPIADIGGPEHHLLYNFFVFIRFWPYLSNLFFFNFWPKRPSTIARTIVPLTTPLGGDTVFVRCGSVCLLCSGPVNHTPI